MRVLICLSLSLSFFPGGTTLLEAAQAAPDEKKRAKFVALVKELKCGDESVEDLLR